MPIRHVTNRQFRPIVAISHSPPLAGEFQNFQLSGESANTATGYSFTVIPSAFILRYMWLRSRPSTSAVRLTLPWFSSSFFRM